MGKNKRNKQTKMSSEEAEKWLELGDGSRRERAADRSKKTKPE